MAESVIQTKKKRGAVSHLQNYFLTEGKRSLTFKKVVPEAFYIKLLTINGQSVYPFTKDYTTLIIPKFELSGLMEYYVYEKDIINFNNMSSSEQLEYLNSVKFEDVSIGVIESSTIQQMLFNKYIKCDQQYIGNVIQSNYIPNSFWWRLNIGNDTIDINTNKLIKYGYDLILETEYTPKQLQPSNTEKIIEAINGLKDSNQFLLAEKDFDARAKGYSKIISVYAKHLKTDEGKHMPLFNVIFSPGIDNFNNIKTYAQIKVHDQFKELIDSNIPDSATIKVYKLDSFKECIHSLSNVLGDNKNPYIRQLSNVLDEF